MIYKNGERMRDFFGPFGFYCSLVFSAECTIGMVWGVGVAKALWQ